MSTQIGELEEYVVQKQKDMRSEKISKMAALGESTTWGYSVSSKDKCFVNLTCQMLEEFQGAPIELINQGIGANVLTTLCPAYDISVKPCAHERLQEDVINQNPDLLLLSYGLNDSRGGINVLTFKEEYQRLIDRIRAEINPIIVILNTFYMHEEFYDLAEWNHSNYEVTDIFNLAIKQLAEQNKLILADIYSAEAGVDWVVDNDHCHPNDLGHRLIANRVFEAIVRNCSFTALTIPEPSRIVDFQNAYGGGRPETVK